MNNQEELVLPAGEALLDAIGKPVILITHSQGGGMGFDVTDKRPKLVAGMVAIEPGGPQIAHRRHGQSRLHAREIRISWGLTDDAVPLRSADQQPFGIKSHLEPSDAPGDEVGCYMQDEPVHKLVEL